MYTFVVFYLLDIAMSNTAAPPTVKKRLVIRYSIIGWNKSMAFNGSVLAERKNAIANQTNSANNMGRRVLSIVTV